MSDVNVVPMPEWARKLSPRLRPMHPPIFAEGEPTRADIEFAIELLKALDTDSLAWYGGNTTIERLRARLDDA